MWCESDFAARRICGSVPARSHHLARRSPTALSANRAHCTMGGKCLLSMGQCLAVAVLLLVVCALPATHALQPLDLVRHVVADAASHGAICTDHSPAIYYLHQYPGVTQWMIFFESGGVCSNDVQCVQRYKKSPELMSSTEYPEHTTGRDLLSTDPSDNPFAGFNRVLIPYCSNDLFLGRSRPHANVSFSPTEAGTFAFAGRLIAKRIVEELANRTDPTHEHLGLAQATEVVVGGSSAGGIGALNILRFVQRNITREGTRLSAIADSSWFIDFFGQARHLFNDNMINMTNLTNAGGACRKQDGPSPCCLSSSCVLEKVIRDKPSKANRNHFVTTAPSMAPSVSVGVSVTAQQLVNLSAITSADDSIHVMMLVSRFDIYILGRALKALKFQGRLGKDSDVATVISAATEAIDNYAGVMSSTLKRSSQINTKFSYVEVSCAQHLYLATSTLWTGNGILAKDATRNEDLDKVQFKITVKPGIWKRVFVKGQSVQQHVRNWYAQVNGTQRASAKSYIRRDTCLGIGCNPSCPEVIRVVYKIDGGWPTTWSRVIVILCNAFLVLCCAVKILLYIEVRRLLPSLNRYMMREEPDGGDCTYDCLPECPDFGRVSIACHCLNYIVPIPSSGSQEVVEEAAPEPLSAADIILDAIADPDEEVEEDEDGLDGSGLFGEAGDGEQTTPCDDSLTSTMSNGQPSSSSLIIRRNDPVRSSMRSTRSMRRNSRIMTRQEFSEKQEVFRQMKDQQFISRSDFSTSTLPNSASAPSDLSASPSQRHSPAETSQVPRKASSTGQLRMLKVPAAVERSESNLTSRVAGRVQSIRSVSMRRKSKQQVKVILNNVTTYFNAGELVAVMGPSGSGKTTFMDLITGRQHSRDVTGEIIVNGHYLRDLTDWYKHNTGYVLQLATPFYDELTVKENLLYAAMMRVPAGTPKKEIFQRVEMAMLEVGLFESADTVVGGTVGGGLSGGQKRRLSVAIQLIRLPNVLFLDEPTSGLDAHSSLELIRMLSVVAKGGRLVVMSIHQPRLEIYHMFDKILFMCSGKVAFYGSPVRAPQFFMEALRPFVDLESPSEDMNPADLIMDLMDSKDNQHRILDFYQTSTEPAQIETAVRQNIEQAQQHAGQPPEWNHCQASVWMRLVGLEGRGTRLKLGSLVYVPIIIICFGLALGIAYRNTSVGFLLAACYNIVTGAPFLFITPFYVKLILGRMLHLFALEHEDGVCRAVEFVVHTFLSAVAVTLVPLVVMSAVVYALIAPSQNFSTFCIVTLLNLMSNAVSLSIVIALSCAVPRYAVELSHIVCGYVTFFQGFLYTMPNMEVFLRWMVYPNPYYWAFSGELKALLGDVQLKCDHASPLRCLDKDGKAVLALFGFEDSNEYLSLAVLLGMVPVFLFLAILSLLQRDELTQFLTLPIEVFKRACRPRKANAAEATPFQLSASGTPDGLDLEEGIPNGGKLSRLTTPDVFDTSPDVAGDLGRYAREEFRKDLGRSISVPVGQGSGTKFRYSSISTLMEENEPHIMRGGSQWVSGEDLFKASQLRKSQRPYSSMASVGPSRPKSGSGNSSVFSGQHALASQGNSTTTPAGVFSGIPSSPGSRPSGYSNGRPNLVRQNTQFPFSGSSEESALKAQLVIDSLDQSAQAGSDTRGRREQLAKLHARQRQRLISANLTLARDRMASVAGSLSESGANSPSPTKSDLRCSFSRLPRKSSTLSLRPQSSQSETSPGKLKLQQPPNRREKRVMQSAPNTPMSQPWSGSSTSSGVSAANLHSALYGMADSDGSQGGRVTRPRTLLVGSDNSEPSSLAGTPHRSSRLVDSETLPRAGHRRGSAISEPKSSPRSSPDIRKGHHGRSSLDRQVFPKQARAELKVVESLRSEEYRTAPQRQSDNTGLLQTPSTTTSSSSADLLADSPLSHGGGVSPLAKRNPGLRKPQPILSQDRSTSSELSSPDHYSASAGARPSSATPSQSTPVTATHALSSHADSTTTSVSTDRAKLAESPNRFFSTDSWTGQADRLGRRSSHPQIETNLPADVLSPIDEGSSRTPSPRPHDTITAPLSDSPNVSRTLKSILRKRDSDGSADKGQARTRPGVVFTGEFSESSFSEPEYSPVSPCSSQTSSSPGTPDSSGSHVPPCSQGSCHAASSRSTRTYGWLSSLHHQPIIEASQEDDLSMTSPPPQCLEPVPTLFGNPLECAPVPPECIVTEGVLLAGGSESTDSRMQLETEL